MKKNLIIIFSLIFFINTNVFAEKVDALKKFKEILGEEAKKKMSLAYDSLTKHKQILNYNEDEEAVEITLDYSMKGILKTGISQMIKLKDGNLLLKGKIIINLVRKFT